MDSLIGRRNTRLTYNSLYNNWVKNKTAEEVILTEVIGVRTKLAILRLIKRHRPEEITSKVEGAMKYFSRNQEDPNKIKALSKVQATKIMNICKTKYPKFYPVMLLALHAGLRRGEIFGLKWKNVDFINKQVFIHNSYDGPTKNGKSRKIPISKELAKSLKNNNNLVEDENAKLFSNVNPNKTLEKICGEANVPKITIHQLRHTYATLALDSGVSPVVVSKLLGHSNLSTTLNIYWQNVIEDIRLDFLPGV